MTVHRFITYGEPDWVSTRPHGRPRLASERSATSLLKEHGDKLGHLCSARCNKQDAPLDSRERVGGILPALRTPLL